jgi:PucR family transcriptional regulator, purine catabolism regulatory protein
MGKVANDSATTAPELPAPAPPLRATSTGTFTFGLPVREVLGASSLQGAHVLAGARGLDRVVQRLNVMEVPDILPWVKPHELLLTTGYPLRDTPQALADLVVDLDARGLAALGVKLGRYLDALPPEMLAEADRLGFPIIQLPDGVGFDDILNQVLTDVLNHQARDLARSEEVHRALVHIVLAGGGLPEVTDELVDLLGGAVFVTTADGRILSESGDAEARARARASGCFDETGRFRTETQRAGVQPNEGLPGAHAVVAVVAGSLDHGRIVAFDETGELGEREVHVLERAATVAALAITKQLAVGAVESKYRGDFVRDLITGRAGPAEQALAHCASLGWDLARPLVVVVAEFDAGTGEQPPGGLELRPVQERLAAAWATVARTWDAAAPVVGFSQEVVALLGTPADGDVERLVRQVVRQVSGDGGGGRRSFSTGVSRIVTSVAGIPAAYEQARKAVQVGRQLHGRGAVAHFDGLGVFRLLSLLPDTAELRGFLEETLGELATRDDVETDDLRNTLQVLLDTNLNVAETARRLHFHYNTLRYRIGKLERMLGPFTEDPHLRLNLALALQVRRMQGL